MNFTASTWKVIDSATLSLSEAYSYATNTSYTSGTNFTPGAITVEGIILWLRGVNNNSGKLSAEIYNATSASSVVGTEVEINVSDLFSMSPTVTSTNQCGGAFYLKFSSSVTLAAATNYNIRVKSSVSSSVYLNSVSSSNWSRGLVTSTTAAPSASDNLFILAPFTTTSTPSTVVCTMNNTSSTVFGSVQVSGFGKVELENLASTDYVLKIANGGLYKNYTNGISEFGTSSSRVQSTSSILLELQSSSSGGNGLDIRSPSVFKMYGASKTRKAKLNSNASAGATSLTTDISTGWLNGDEIAIANTTRASNSFDKKALTANASGTTLTITAIATAKEGTSPVQADLGNCTSNAKIYGSSATNTAYVVGDINSFRGGYSFEFDQVEFRYFGSATANKHGISFLGQSTNIKIKDCAFHDLSSSARVIYSNNTHGDFEATGNIIYGGSYAVDIISSPTIAATSKLNDNLTIGASTGIALGRSTALNNNSNGLEIKNNTCNGHSTYGMQIISNNWNPTNVNFDNNTSYGCSGSGGISLSSLNSNLGSMTAYRCSTGLTSSYMGSTVISNYTSFGCTNRGLVLNAAVTGNIYFKQITINAGTGEVCPQGLYFGGSFHNVYFGNFQIGTTTTHSTTDITIGSTVTGNIVFIDGSLGSTTKIQSLTNIDKGSFISIQKDGGTSGNDFSYGPYGTISNDSTIYDTSPRSLRLTPSNATTSQISPLFSVNLVSGQAATMAIKVRKSVVGDGAAYNGTMQPKIWMKANPSAGSSFDSDTLMATATAASDGAWEELTLSIPTASDNTAVSFYLEAIGTAGWVNVDSVRIVS